MGPVTAAAPAGAEAARSVNNHSYHIQFKFSFFEWFQVRFQEQNG